MIFAGDSLTIVLLGDWNRFYIQPNWIADNVYGRQEIEMGVNGQGIDFSVTYRCDGVTIAPSQSQILFTSINTEHATLERLITCVNNFLQRATTPILNAYGFNCDYIDSDGSQFADVRDHMTDNDGIITCGYEIKASKITRTLYKAGKIINLESVLDGNQLRFHFNEHHGESTSEMPNMTIQQIEDFLRESRELVKAFGYEIEDEE